MKNNVEKNGFYTPSKKIESYIYICNVLKMT